jgi:hypothetical protein
MKRQGIKIVVLVLLLAGTAVACEEKNENPVEIPFIEYSLSDTKCQWKNLAYDNQVTVINSYEDLEKYIDCLDDSYPEIDFSKNTLLLAGGGTPYNISEINYQILKSGNNYELVVEIILGDATVIGAWTMALITERLNFIRLNVKHIRN